MKLCFSDPANNLYVSVSGRALIVNDRERMAPLFTPIMKQWFATGADDPTHPLFVDWCEEGPRILDLHPPSIATDLRVYHSFW